MKKQVLRFGVVGVINTLVDITSFVVLIHLGVALWVAIFISTSLGLLCSFALNRSFVFRSSGRTDMRTIGLFLAVTCFGLWVMQPLIIQGLAVVFSDSSDLALSVFKLVATGFTMVWNFFWYRSAIFR